MPRATVGVLALLTLVGGATPVAAQDIRWRTDYAAARKEATATGRPLLLDFGTEACVWCRKLDATTFRDRGVVALVNEKVIPVKVDADRDAWLARAAGVEAYPTLVLLAADGKVIARHDGYADVAKMASLLRQAVPREVPKPVATRSAAADLLAFARTDHDAGRYLACIERCDRLMSDHPAAPEAADARRLSAAITGDPQKWQLVRAQLETDLTALHRNLDAALKR